MNKTTNKLIGYKGEDIAIEFLEKNDFIIKERNYRFKHYEIDIIAQKNKCIHFIEVKFRKNNSFGYPESFVSENQKFRIKTAAEDYIYKNNWNENIKFDIISIENNKTNYKIKIFEDSF